MSFACSMAVVLALTLALNGVEPLLAEASDVAKDRLNGGELILKRLVKRQVSTIYHPPADQVRYTGLDPYEERLLIIVLGSCIAVLFAVIFLIICCRTYRVDRKAISGGGGMGGGDEMGTFHQQQQQQLMMYGAQAGRQAYFATGHEPGVAMDPAYLDPGKAGFAGGMQQPQQQQQQQQQMVDNTAYASLGGFDRPYSHQRI